MTRDNEPRHQHDMRAFVMAARLHSKTGKLSEVRQKNLESSLKSSVLQQDEYCEN